MVLKRLQIESQGEKQQPKDDQGRDYASSVELKFTIHSLCPN